MTGSLAFRAVLAVTLMVIYIALAVGAVAGLVWVGQFLLTGLASGGRVSIWIVVLGIACFVAAAVIVWSMFPRIDKFEPPGPEITEREQPALFAEIRRIADATGEQMPKHVYVMWEINAFVAQRGGIMGVGSRRVMGLGLPLMRVLTVSEMRAVVAHEMGHFFGGDTKLGPWIYKTRGAIGRTIINLAKAADGAAHIADLVHILFVVILAPFRWFGDGFMYITQAISRAQELSADRVAARCEGKTPLVEGLKKTHAGALAHELYMRSELLPVVEEGVLPPAGEGFSKFMKTELVSKLLDDVVKGELAESTSDPYDSHPPLKERIEALDAVDAPARTLDDRCAIDLLADADRIEHDLIASKLATPVQAVRWDEVTERWMKRWRETSALIAKASDATIGELPAKPAQLHGLCKKIEGDVADHIEDEQIVSWAISTLGACLCVALLDAGFTATTDVGAPVTLSKDDFVVEPYRELGDYLRGETSADNWRARWQALGLAEQPLAR